LVSDRRMATFFGLTTVARSTLSVKFQVLRLCSRCSTNISTLTRMNSYRDEEIGIIKFHTPGSKENIMDINFMMEFYNCLNKFTQDDSIKGIVVMSGKSGSFIAGADTKIIASCHSVAEATALSLKCQAIMNRIHSNYKPVVAAINGTCLGGGLELALACDYRIAVNSKKTIFGLPEVRLGLLPGAGGTQRLPRLISIIDSMDLMLTGKTISASKAKSIGLVDMLVEPLGPGLHTDEDYMIKELEQGAVQVLRNLLTTELVALRKLKFPHNLVHTLLDIELFRNLFFVYMRNKVEKSTHGHYPAPSHIVNVPKPRFPLLRYLMQIVVYERFGNFAQAFGLVATSPESKSLIHLFTLSTECKKNPFAPVKKEPKSLAVIGAGLMGCGIAQVSIYNGFVTYLKDVDKGALLQGERSIAKHLDKRVKQQAITTLEKDNMLANLYLSVDYEAIKNADLVVEAVYEDVQLKQKVLREIEQYVRPDCVIASNTSAISISEVAEASKRPENVTFTCILCLMYCYYNYSSHFACFKVVGMHYFSPVDKMQLLEVITTPKTSREAASAAVDVGLKQNKLVVVVKDSPGFYTTRVLAAMLSETIRLLQEGVGPKELNDLCTGFGFPVGFATLADEVGIDVALHIAKYLGEKFGQRMAGGDLIVLQKMVDNNYLGRKSGKGCFDYSKSKTKRGVNEKALQILKDHAKSSRGCDSDHDRQLRMVSRFVNEALLCLEEGVISSPRSGDIGAVFGLGFPPFLGGPFRFVDNYGAERLVTEMDRYRDSYEDAVEFQACQLLRDHAKDSKRKFYAI
ncbi:Trifunctional enzyme subunit alpha, mitochondrial, partial [Trichinella sp. T9]